MSVSEELISVIITATTHKDLMTVPVTQGTF